MIEIIKDIKTKIINSTDIKSRDVPISLLKTASISIGVSEALKVYL